MKEVQKGISFKHFIFLVVVLFAMAPGLKIFSKKRVHDGSPSSSLRNKGSSLDKDSSLGVSRHKQEDMVPPVVSPLELPKLRLPDYIATSFGGETIVRLVSLADARDDLVEAASAGFFPDVITGSVDLSMAIVEAMLHFSESIDQDTLSSEENMRGRVKAFILSVLDAVYGPNCVRVAVYNPDVDWSISLWQMFPVPDSPSSRSFLALMPSQSDAIIQWLDLKSRLIKQCRNPKREAQRSHRIAALEEELQELALRHAAMIERFIKIQQGEKDPEAAQAKREGEAKRLVARKAKLKQILNDRHSGVDQAIRTKRDAFLWGGQPHIMASMAALNNSTTISKAGSMGERVRRISRFGFRSEPDDNDLEISSESSERPESEQGDQTPPEPEPANNHFGCFSVFKCCRANADKKGRGKRRPSTRL